MYQTQIILNKKKIEYKALSSFSAANKKTVENYQHKTEELMLY